MAKPGGLDSNYSWIRLVITLAIAIIGNIGMWSFIVVMPAVQAEFDTDRADVSMPFMMTMIGFALGNLLIGRAVDRFGITPALIGSALAAGVGYLAVAYAQSIWLISIIHIIIGFGTAASFGPLIADISHWFQRRRGIAVAIAASGNYLSGAIWPMLLSGVLTDMGWRWVYLALAVITIAALVPLAFLLRPKPSKEHAAESAAKAAVQQNSIGFSPGYLQLILSVAGIGCCIAMAMPQVHIVSLSADLGYGAVAGAKMLSIMLMGGVASRLVSGFVADRYGGIRTLLAGSVLQCIALFLYLPAQELNTLYIVSFIFGLSQGGIIPSYALIVREYLPANEGGARIGFVIMATIVGMALGGWMSGWIRDLTGSYQMAFANGIVWNFLNIAIITMLLIKTRSNRRVVA